MTWGEYRRAKPRLNVLRGFAGNEPQSLTHSAPPNIAEGSIYSGQVIILNSDGEWIKATLSNAAGKVVYFAYHDAIIVNGVITTDTDVKSSGLLLGLSSLGDFEIQTAYFDTGDTWHNGDPVVVSATAGNVNQGAAFAATQVLGVASRAGVEDIAAINTEGTVDANGAMNVLNIVTHWMPAT
jgi:hypothetical protein